MSADKTMFWEVAIQQIRLVYDVLRLPYWMERWANVAFHSSYVNCCRHAAVVHCTQNTVDWGEKLDDAIRAMVIVS